MNFEELHKNRKTFLLKNANKDNVIIPGERNILISAPHGVSQVRLGKPKHAEIGSLTTSLYLQKATGCYFIAKTKNNFDDANFDENSIYKRNLFDLIENKNINYVIDFHGVASFRSCDVNLGTNFGRNIEKNIPLFDNLVKSLRDNGFIVEIDQPFNASYNSISSSVKKKFVNSWTLQVEINYAITNNRKNFIKFQKLLEIFENWLNSPLFK